jgi:K+-sensing histidine kinase KdpD
MEPFGRICRNEDRSHEVTGLGLPLTKRLIDVRGGALSIESEPEVGTTVRLNFPSDKVVELQYGIRSLGDDDRECRLRADTVDKVF